MLKANLPAQVTESEKKSIDAIAEKAVRVLKGTFVLFLLVSVCFPIFRNMAFIQLRSIQMFAHILLIPLMYPAILVSFYLQIMVYVRLQFVPVIDEHFS